MRLQVLADAAAELEVAPGCGDLEISGLTADSRAVEPGWLFAALPGSKANGAEFVGDAIAKGARAILIEDGADITLPDAVARLRPPDPPPALPQPAARSSAP